jgi:hypothetical protein
MNEANPIGIIKNAKYSFNNKGRLNLNNKSTITIIEKKKTAKYSDLIKSIVGAR